MMTSPFDKITLATQFEHHCTRKDAEIVRNFILTKMDQTEQVEIDCNDIIFTPSFADGCFGLIAEKIGKAEFLNRIKLTNLSPASKSLLRHVILRRVSSTPN